MPTPSAQIAVRPGVQPNPPPCSRLLKPLIVAFFALVLNLAITGCQSPSGGTFASLWPDPSQPKAHQPKPDLITLHEGDTVRLSFPGAPNLNTDLVIRRDGMVTLPMGLGEFKAAGLTPPDMENALLKLFAPQLQTKELSVAVISSAFPVYVTGAVLRPGKILSDRPLTALEAIMEAGGFDYTKANMKAVRVIRTVNGQTEHHTVNLKGVLRGDASDTFKLKPDDILYVPERFSWF